MPSNMSNNNVNKLATLVQSAMCKTSVKARPNPSVFFFPGLESKPVHANARFKFVQPLIDNYDTIVDEYTKLINNKNTKSDYVTNDEHKLHSGQWSWYSYIIKGKRQAEFAVQCPKTVEVLESIKSPALMTNTPFSFAFFSKLNKLSLIDPHYGPCNIRLRCHFPLLIPDGDCGMQIGEETVKWQTKVPLVFDDCYQHHVWNNTPKDRVVLLFDVWHPDLTRDEIEAITLMFEDAREKGWLK